MINSETLQFTILPHLKTDLQISAKEYDSYLVALIDTAQEMIKTEGIQLAETTSDYTLVEMYAAFLYRQRKGTQSVMPRSLRWALNNRLFSQKAKEGD